MTTLTDTQRRYVALVLAGLSNKEIAEATGKHVQTVKNALTDIYARLGIERRTQLVALAWEEMG